jgi:hypothetical protein
MSLDGPRRLLLVLPVALGALACPRGPGTTPVPPPEPLALWPLEGPGAAEPQPAADPDLPWLDRQALTAAGWELVAPLALPTATTPATGPGAVTAARALDGSAGAWLLLDPALPLAEAPVLRFDTPEPPIPLWPVDGPEREGWIVVAEQPTAATGDPDEPLASAWRIDLQADPPRVELLWEALEPADQVAVVDLEGEGSIELVSLRWYDVCPDPLEPGSPAACGPPPPGAAEGCVESPPADPCLLLRAWTGGDGVPRTWRTSPRADGRLATLGDPTLDRLVALLLSVDCRYLDLRRLTVRREADLLEPGVEGELLEAVSCLERRTPPPLAAGPRVVVQQAPDGVGLPSGRELPLLAPAADATEPSERWSRGYRLLPDLDGDGRRDWVWLERSAAGTRHVVTRGPDGSVAGTLFVSADGELLERLVAPPAGGHARLEALDWRAAPDPAVLVDVRLEAADGSSRTERVTVPLVFR